MIYRVSGGGIRGATCLWMIAQLCSVGISGLARATELDHYVGTPDNHHSWKKLQKNEVDAFSCSHLEMTSQQWREHVWAHDLQIVRPQRVRNEDVAFLFITGDGDGNANLPMLRVLAERAGAIAAV